MESEIRVETPPTKQIQSQIQVVSPKPDSKSQRTERIVKTFHSLCHFQFEQIRLFIVQVLLETSANDDTTSVSVIPKTEDQPKQQSSEDETEIDLRERLLREKAIKSMKRRQLSQQQQENQSKTTTERIVYHA